MSTRAITMALETKGISPRAKVLLVCLANCASDETFTCFPGRKYLSGLVDCSVDTVDRALKELAQANLVEISHQWAGGGDRVPVASLYRVFPWHDPSHRTASTPGRTNTATPSRESAASSPHSLAATVAARGAATKETSLKHSAVVVAKRARENVGFVKRAQEVAGDALNLACGHVHHGADLRRLVDGGCDFERHVIPAIQAVAADIRAKGRKPINSWAHPALIDAAQTLRDRDAAGLPPPRHHSENRHGRYDQRADERAAWDALCPPLEDDAADRAGPPVALGEA